MAKNQKNNINWGKETAHTAKLILRVIWKFFSAIINVLLTVLLIGLICAVIVGGALAFYIKNYVDISVDDFTVQVSAQNQTTKIYYMDYEDRVNRIGTPVEIEEERIYGGENRVWASYDQMPEYLIEAFISIEDERFWDHKGVDWKRTLGATFYFFQGGKSYGGSTITQQLIKNVTGRNEAKIQRKIQEIFCALELEKLYDKTQILENYLNIIPMSQKCYGVQAAAHKYFNKDVSELNLQECALLAAIPNAPTTYDPIRNPENALKRRNDVLFKMHELGKITDAEYEAAWQSPIELDVQTGNTSADQSTNIRSWYSDAAFNEAVELLMEELEISEIRAQQMVYTGGLQIYTAMDPEIQAVVDEYFANPDNFQRVDDSVIQPECSMVILDAETSDVLAIAGGRKEKTGNLVLNYATDTTRSPGSSIKPLTVYAPALEAGIITYGTAYDDTPYSFGTETVNADGSITYSRPYGYPENYPAGYRGLTTVHDAITRSVNTIALKVLQDLGVDESFDFAHDKLHMTSFIDNQQLTGGTVISDRNISALGLGGMSYGVTVMEITAAYGIFANEGIYTKPRMVLKILDSEGNLIVNNEPESEIVISAQTATIMTKMLQEVVSGASGTANKMTVDELVDVAGKTGTTSDDNDRWFVGYTPYYIGGVWFGYDMPRSLNSFTKNPSPAAKAFDDIMRILHEKEQDKAIANGEELKKFSDAGGIIQATYCRDSGLLLTDACKADPRGSRAEVGYFTAATVPTQPCDCHILVDYDVVTGAVACPDCPRANVIQVGLIQVERSFPRSVTVTDAQYVYRTIDLRYMQPVLDNTQAFFGNLLAGAYPGVSSNGVQYNRYCSEHYRPGSYWYEDETGGIDWSYDDPDDPGYEDETGAPETNDASKWWWNVG